jgi:hypothetical protein
MTPKIIILAPRYSDEVNAMSYMAKQNAARNEEYPPEYHVDIVADVSCKGSLLPYSFNSLFALALDERDKGNVTHSLMVHADIGCPFGFANALYQVMQERGDVSVSAVVPIKEHGRVRTSTAVGQRWNSFGVRRFINTSDRAGMPQSFGTADVAESHDEVLLINTGLWLADLRHPGWDDFHFEFLDRIRKNPETGRREAMVASEDWLLARYMDAKGMPYSATWLNGVCHYGPDYWTPDEMPPVYPRFVAAGVER